MKLGIIGAGSSYTPEIIEHLTAMRHSLPVRELMLMDIHPIRLETVAGFCRRFARHLGGTFEITTTTSLPEVIQGAAFLITQIRVGGNQQRVLDERIPLKYGIIGQGTTGPGGMFKALRTIPPMLEIAALVEQLNPGAWIINYVNPTGMITEALQRFTRTRVVGLCAGGFFPRDAVSQALGVPADQVRYDYFGLNHLNFAWNVTVGGKALSDDEFNRVAQVMTRGAVDPELIRRLRLLPSPYLQYYFHRIRAVAHARQKRQSRGEEVQKLEKEIFAAFNDPAQVTKPPALALRGGGGYSEVALGVIDALHNDRGDIFIVNTAQRGAVPFLPGEAVLELPCLVEARGITPLIQPPPPVPVWGLVAAVKNYEQLAIEAAITGDRTLALEALLAHPLVGDYDLAVPLLDEMLTANRDYLPQFFR